MANAGINIDIFGTYSCQSASTSSVKSVMAKAGINIDIFGAHRCRSASFFSMGHKGVTIDKIIKSAGRSTCSIKFLN